MNLIKYFLLPIIGVLATVCVSAQSQTVRGHIYALQGGQVLSGASIELVNDTAYTLSNEVGYFEIKTNDAQGALRVSMLGYKTQIVQYEGNDKPLNIQLEADAVALNEVRVTAYGSLKTNKETAGAIAHIADEQIRQGSGVSLQAAFNSVPGVQMDQSTLSEARISIRGNGVRSPYGIRKVKIYVNDIPVTEPDGMTRIETLDVNSIGQAEIIKGPASSLYGGGTAGVIHFKLQRAPYQERSIGVSSLSGAFGLRRLATIYRNGGDKVNSYIAYGWQQWDGYRAHSYDMRRFLTGNFQFFPSDKQIVTVLVHRTTQHAQIPGSLSQGQVRENRMQANASNLEKKAGRYQNWTRIGVGQQYRFNEKLSNATSVFTYFFDLDHPLPFAYLRTYYQSFGGRTKFDFNPGFKTWATQFTVGAEWNQAHSKGTRYVNLQGAEGAINDNTDYKNTLYSVFYQSETALGPHTSLVVGVSYNGLTYDAMDFLDRDQSGVKRFKPQASPRVALSHTFGEALSLHGSVSAGFSPPAGSEIKNVDGSINTQLQAEKGINYEINAKGNVADGRLAYDLALFKMDMKGELIGQSVEQGITIYQNAGRTEHKGVELALSYQAIEKKNAAFVTVLRPYAAITYSDFRFEDYKIRDAQNAIEAIYDGNPLTGIAPWIVSAGLHMETALGLYGHASYFFNDRLPLNDANTFFNPSYQIVNAKLGYRTTIRKRFNIDIYAGLDNITDSRYSSMTSLNAVAYGGGTPAYFNPALPRNGYAGLNLKYLF